MKKLTNKRVIAVTAAVLCMAALSVPAFADGYFASDESGGNTPPSSIDSITIDTENVKLPENKGFEPLTPDGNMNLIDDILQNGDYYASTETILQDKQFITVQSKNGNYFYLVIDRSGDKENVYFLNLVDEADLLALMEDGSTAGTEAPKLCSCTEKCVTGEVNNDCEVCSNDKAQCIGKEKPAETEPVPAEPETPEKKNNSGTIIVILLVLALAGGGAFYYFKIRKNKPQTKGPADLDDYDFGGDEDDDIEYETEDDSE